MKSKASGLLNKITAALASMARSKALALKSKTRALKARLIIFSLLSNKKFLAGTISHKLHNVLAAQHHRDNKLKSHNDDDDNNECNGDVSDSTEEDQAAVLYRDARAVNNTVPHPTHTEPVRDNLHYGDGDGGGDGDENDREKYPDLTHWMFVSEEDPEFDDPGGSVIDLVKNSKQEAGEPFSLEEEIDHVADLFIKRFHRQMRIQKQQSLRERQEMLQRGL